MRKMLMTKHTESAIELFAIEQFEQLVRENQEKVKRQLQEAAQEKPAASGE